MSGFLDSSPTERASIDTDELREPLTETRRIMRTGTVWVASGAVVPVLGLGPLVAAGWRPGDLPFAGGVAFWAGALAAGIGLALLIWAACPVPAFPLEQAHPQKVFSMRVGIVMNVAGMSLAGLAILLSPGVVPGG